MSKVQVNGTDLEYQEHGQGETVVFVHGSSSDYRTWKYQIDEFAKSFRTISYSRRYHYPNESIADSVDYSMREQQEDLKHFIQALDTEAVHLVGHSYGAFLALLLAIEQPELIHSLVLEEPPVVTLFIGIPPKPQEILKLLLTRPKTATAIIHFAVTGLNPATEAAEQGDMDKALRIFGSAVLGTEVFNTLSNERIEQARANNIKTEYTGSGFLPVQASDIRQVQIPTMLINGANSPAMFHRLLDRLHELLPHSERVIIPSASHIAHEDNASAYNATVLPFIKRQHVSI